MEKTREAQVWEQEAEGLGHCAFGKWLEKTAVLEMQHMRGDSTEKEAAASVCAVAATVLRNFLHCEDSQQLFSPAHPEHTT